jgi:hypothetical protein
VTASRASQPMIPRNQRATEGGPQTPELRELGLERFELGGGEGAHPSAWRSASAPIVEDSRELGESEPDGQRSLNDPDPPRCFFRVLAEATTRSGRMRQKPQALIVA